MTNETMSKRDQKNVLNKIQHIEKTFREAHNFATSETGAGLKEGDTGTFEEDVKRKCPYYFELVDIMADRASSKPKATSYDLLSNGEDDDDDEEADDGDDVEPGAKADDNVSEMSVAESVASKQTESVATKQTTASSKKNSSRKKARQNATPFEDETVAALTSASETAEAKMKEMSRHNKFQELETARHNKYLEGLEERKLELQEQELKQKKEERENRSWKGRNEELDYKMNLLRRYNELKKDHGMSEEAIVAMFPEMKKIIECKSND